MKVSTRERVNRGDTGATSLRGLLSDADYAVLFTRSRATTRGMSRRRIAAELANRGVARGLVDDAVVKLTKPRPESA